MNKLIEAIVKEIGLAASVDCLDIIRLMDGRHGWKLVPVEPTEEQVTIVALLLANTHCIDAPKLDYPSWMGLSRQLCRDMLAASPDPLGGDDD